MSKTVTLLDGATGTALRARGVRVANYKSSIWSAFAVDEAPEAVKALHADYMKAGSDVVTANNYSLTTPMLTREGMEDRQADMIQKAVQLAVEARDETKPGAKVAASLPPLNTSFRSDLVGAYEDNLAEYREIVKAASAADMFMCETLTTIEEAKAAVTAGLESGKPVWVSFTIRPQDGHLRGGESVEDAVAAMNETDVEAILFNCTGCDAITRTMAKMPNLTTKRFGAYCNPVMHEIGDDEPEQVITHLMSATEYADEVEKWVASGATMVGGCCDTDPDYIAEINTRVA